MRLKNIKIINYRLILAVWVLIWLIFLARAISADYKILSATYGKTVDEKRSYIMKGDLYEFILFCEKRLPEEARYKIASKEGAIDSLNEFRAIYYLYPRLMVEEKPSYILVFEMVSFEEPGYKIFEKFTEDSFILKSEGI